MFSKRRKSKEYKFHPNKQSKNKTEPPNLFRRCAAVQQLILPKEYVGQQTTPSVYPLQTQIHAKPCCYYLRVVLGQLDVMIGTGLYPDLLFLCNGTFDLARNSHNQTACGHDCVGRDYGSRRNDTPRANDCTI